MKMTRERLFIFYPDDFSTVLLLNIVFKGQHRLLSGEWKS
jgi:hypothetical protein